MLNQLFSRLWFYGVFCAVLLAFLVCWIVKLNQPVNIVVPVLNSHNKLNCVSYAPYYGKNQSPLIVGVKVSPAQIEADLKRLASISDCVRTYSVGQGLDYVPEAASKIGLKVYLGAWVGWVNADNEAEIKLAIKRANQYPNTVQALIIGNEVYLRQEQSPATMHRYLQYAKNHTNTPITYAEVWEFWNKHQETAQYVDFITVHILPYWEDNPVAIDDAINHASNIMNQLAITFKKPILIGETGWPSLGRQRNASKPSLLNQARYVREFLQTAHEKNWQYNIIEAIDQPWKRVLEGTVGGYWGLFNSNLQLKFSLSHPVAERTDGALPMYLGLIGALLLMALGLLSQEVRVPVLFGNACLGAVAGLVAMLQYDYLIAACRDTTEWIALGGVAAVGWLAILIMPWHIAQVAKRALSAKSANHGLRAYSLIKSAHLVLIIAAIIASALIVIDGRYRDYPNMLFMLPALFFSVGLVLSRAALQAQSRLNYLFCALLFVFAGLCLIQEPNNHAAMVWFGLNCLLGLASWPRNALIPSTKAA